MTSPEWFCRTHPGPDQPYEIYQFEGGRVILKRVTPNAMRSGSPKIDEIARWTPANFLCGDVNPRAKSEFQKLWNALNAPRS